MIETADLSVSIGMPVYNGGATLREAIESILAQSHTDFRLFISDNCSTDSTELICRSFAARDERVTYVRQAQFLSAAENFNYVLSRATSKYFVWAAADDQRSPDFLEVNLRFLELNPDFVASTSPTRFVTAGFDEVAMGDGPLEGSVEQRFLRFFSSWHANSRFYSLFRRSVLVECVNSSERFLGADWVLVLRCLLLGKFGRVNQGWTLLGRDGISNSHHIFRILRTHWHERFIPFYALGAATWKLTRGFSFRTRARIAIKLARLNVRALLQQAKLAMRSRRLRDS